MTSIALPLTTIRYYDADAESYKEIHDVYASWESSGGVSYRVRYWVMTGLREDDRGSLRCPTDDSGHPDYGYAIMIEGVRHRDRGDLMTDVVRHVEAKPLPRGARHVDRSRATRIAFTA